MEETFQIKSLGNILNPNHSGSSFAGYVWDKYYIAPCLNTMQGGYRQPMIIEGINESNISSKR